MFEHTILTAPRTAQKTGALFLSFAAQICAVGVLIVVPLVFHETLPGLRLAAPEPFFLSPLPKAPDPPAAKPAAQAARPSNSIPRIFRSDFLRAPVKPAPDVVLLSTDGIPSLGPAYAPPDAIHSALPQTALPPIEKPKSPPQPPVAAPKPDPAPIPAGGDVQAAKLIKKVLPKYPPIAVRMRVSGTVHLIGIVAKDGTVQNLQVAGGNPLLVQAALEAVRQWLYRPTILDGHAVEVIAPIDVIFMLSQ